MQAFHDAHDELVKATDEAAKPGFAPIPISIVSVNGKIGGQLVIFDGRRFRKDEVVARLRLAADFLENAPDAAERAEDGGN